MMRTSKCWQEWFTRCVAGLLATFGLTAPGLARTSMTPAVSMSARAPTDEVPSADGRTPESVVAALYDVISGPAGYPRDWARFRALFRTDAKLGAVREGTLRLGTLEDYIARSGPILLKEGFFERELARKIERYGEVAHVFSTYASWTHLLEGKPSARGINSIQMVRENGHWRVTSLVWNSETEGDPIPVGYLAAGKTKCAYSSSGVSGVLGD